MQKKKKSYLQIFYVLALNTLCSVILCVEVLQQLEFIPVQ